jgi:hypothetical protein
MPPFLADPNFYFTKAAGVSVSEEVLENISDSEQPAQSKSPEEIRIRFNMQTKS